MLNRARTLQAGTLKLYMEYGRRIEQDETASSMARASLAFLTWLVEKGRDIGMLYYGATQVRHRRRRLHGP